jgi:TolB protein
MRMAWWLVVLALWPWSGDAQVRVVKGAGTKTSIDWSSYSVGGDAAAQTFLKVLGDDLLRSGWFTRGGPGAAELALAGSVSGGGSVRAQVWVTGRVDQRQYLAKSYSADAGAVRRLAHQVADDIVEAVTGRKGILSGKFALVGNRTGKKELYLCDADGQGLVQLTRDGNISVAPNWAPDGRLLAYTSYLKGFPDIYTIELASGRRQRIASYPGLNTGAAFSPDGREMAMILSKDGNPELYIRNVQSGALTRLTETKRAAEASPCWSPDGRQIAYVSDQSGSPQLYVMSRSGGAPRRLTSRGSQNVAPDWGPHNLIAYASLLGGRWNVAVLDPATLDTKQITMGDADYEDPSWATDGRHIVAARAVRYQSKVYLLDTLGDAPIALTDSAGDWYSPAWAPGR